MIILSWMIQRRAKIGGKNQKFTKKRYMIRQKRKILSLQSKGSFRARTNKWTKTSHVNLLIASICYYPASKTGFGVRGGFCPGMPNKDRIICQSFKALIINK
jgi:hypothetical protein